MSRTEKSKVTATEPNGMKAIGEKWGSRSAFHEPALLAGFRARPTDVLITTAPKAGTTWMQQILHQLRSGGDDSFTSIYDVVPWLEFLTRDSGVERALAAYERINDPRVFKTHCTYEQTPGLGTVRIILSSRDPRDCCVSFYHHVMGLSEDMRAAFPFSAAASFDEIVEHWLQAGAWYRNVQSWWPHRNDHNVLWLRYEDMKHDLERAIDSILAFLGWTLQPEQRARVLQYCSFAWMRAHQDRFMPMSAANTPQFSHGSLIRNGQVGDYKATLSRGQQRRIVQKARDELTPECVAFLGLGRTE